MDVTAKPAGCDCRAVSEILSRIGDKWTIQVVVALRSGSQRFNEIKRRVGGISQQMLTRTLKTLERDGMIERTVRPTTPPQVEYGLTPLGHSLSESARHLAIGRQLIVKVVQKAASITTTASFDALTIAMWRKPSRSALGTSALA